MCELTFDREDIALWARFSGDYNPIHFDADRARQLGVNGVVVHGMLALLAVKGRLSQALPQNVGGWWSLRCRMRQPVVAGEPAQLTMNKRDDGLAFSLASPAGRKLMTGSLGRLAERPTVHNSGTRHRLPSKAVTGSMRQLDQFFSWPREFWVAVDALLFAEFLRTGVKDVLGPYGIDLGRNEAASDNGSVVVQTTHEVAFKRDFLAAPRATTLDLEVLPPQAEVIEDSVSATCQLVSRCDGRIVMLTTLGLFIRQAVHGTLIGQRNLQMAA
jgi:MaoC like domain